MKYGKTGQVAALAVAALMMGACGTTSGHQREESSQDRFQKVRDLLAKTKTQVEATIDAADDLVDPATTDPAAAYNSYAKAFDDLKNRDEKLKDAIKESEKSSREYFAAWEKEGAQISDPDLRRASVERRTENYGATQQMLVTANSASNALSDLLATLEDVKRFANFNNTPDTASTLQPIVDRAVKQGDAAKGDLDAAMLDLDATAASSR